MCLLPYLWYFIGRGRADRYARALTNNVTKNITHDSLSAEEKNEIFSVDLLYKYTVFISSPIPFS